MPMLPRLQLPATLTSMAQPCARQQAQAAPHPEQRARAGVERLLLLPATGRSEVTRGSNSSTPSKLSSSRSPCCGCCCESVVSEQQVGTRCIMAAQAEPSSGLLVNPSTAISQSRVLLRHHRHPRTLLVKEHRNKRLKFRSVRRGCLHQKGCAADTDSCIALKHPVQQLLHDQCMQRWGLQLSLKLAGAARP